MDETFLAELEEISGRLSDAAAPGDSEEVEGPLKRVMDAAGKAAKAWSGSNLGFHARVYYSGLQSPPPGAHFDSEWGFRGQFQGTTGDWREFDFDSIVETIYEEAGLANLNDQADLAEAAKRLVEASKPEVDSLLQAWLSRHGEDPLVTKLCSEGSKIEPLTEMAAQKAFVSQGGTKITRDTTALSEGWRAAPHQVVEARVVSITSSFQSCEELGRIAARAAAHIKRLEASQEARGQGAVAAGQNVFIGHGQSAQWRELKDFINDRLCLPPDEFNRVPVAGVTNIARLSEMLDDAGIALLVLTAEDEMADGRDRARQNVVHEAGLFQGRLGFTRAIVLLEDGCEEFSNIQGLGQIRFPAGNISASFEEVRRVLEREGFLSSG